MGDGLTRITDIGFDRILTAARSGGRITEAQHKEIMDFCLMTLEEQTRVVVREHNLERGDLEGEHCPACLDKGYLWFVDPDDNRDYITRECTCKRGRSGYQEARLWRDPPTVGQTFASFRTDERWQGDMLAMAMDYAGNPGNGWLMLMGQPGSGKTHLGYAVLNECLGRGMSTGVMHWQADMAAYKTRLLDDEGKAMMERWKTVSLLLIDDLYRSEPNEKDAKYTFEMIDARYSQGLPTVVTYQYSIPRLIKTGEGLEGEALASRIIERCTDGTGRRFVYRVEEDTKRNWRLRGLI